MFQQLLMRIARTLDEAGLAYMIIGGQAVLLYGEPRLTKDVDVTLGATPEQLPAFLRLTEQMALEPLVDPEPFVRETMVLPCRDPETDIRVDFIFSFSPYEQQALGRVRTVELEATPVRFASPEDVIIHKMVAARPRDHEDVRSILLKQPDLDLPYIRRWLSEFAAALDQPLREQFEDLLSESQ